MWSELIIIMLILDAFVGLYMAYLVNYVYDVYIEAYKQIPKEI